MNSGRQHSAFSQKRVHWFI